MAISILVNRFLSRLGLALVRKKTLEGMLNNAKLESSVPQDNLQRSHTRLAGQQNSAETASTGADRRLYQLVNQAPERCNYLAPLLQDSDVPEFRWRENVIDFHQKGITRLSVDETLTFKWNKHEVINRDVGNRHTTWDWAGNTIAPFSPHIQSGLPSQDLIADLTSIFTSSEMERFFQLILGCSINIGNCRLVQSNPHEGAETGPQGWHHDGTPPGALRGILYLTAVDSTNGPFQYRDTSNQDVSVLGKPGDLLIFDAMRLLHRAMPPRNAIRKAIDFVFLPRLPEKPFQLIVAGMNNWPADPFTFAIPTDKTTSRL